MRVSRLYHSGFAVELDDRVLVFDWYRGTLATSCGKRAYVFVSHEHHDHYDPRIWGLRDEARRTGAPEPTYVLDEDVAPFSPEGARVVMATPSQTFDVDDMRIITLASNDEGVAFLVRTPGVTIYHGGDLNVWWWPNREVELNELSDTICRQELRAIAGEDVDVAFVPLDPRLGPDGARGLEAFMQVVGARDVFPMHYADDRAGALALAEEPRLAPWRDRLHFEDECNL